MNSVWQQITLSNVALYRWQGASYLSRLIGGPLRAWRSGSWLLQWAEPIGALLVSVIFALAPFVSTSLIGILLIACAGFWGLLTLSDEESQQRFTPIHLLVLLYWGISTAATAFSPVKAAAFEGWTKLTLYLLLFALMARLLRSPRIRSWVITVYLHIALIVSGYGLRQYFKGAEALATWTDPESPLAKTTRVYSYLGNPNLLGAYLLPAVILSIAAVFVWRGWMPKALAVTMVIVNTSCLILTLSRGAWIGMVVAIFLMAVLVAHWWSIYLPAFWRTWAIPVLLASLVALLVMAVMLVEPLRLRVSSIFAGRGDSSNNFRVNVWIGVLRMIQDRPILGIGPGNDAFNKIYPLPGYQVSPKFSALSAYSIGLEILVETGVIGLSAFIWLLVVTLNHGWKQVQRLRQLREVHGYWLMAAIATMCGMLAHGLFDTVWYRPQISTLWWFAIALIASYYQPPEQPADAVAIATDE